MMQRKLLSSAEKIYRNRETILSSLRNIAKKIQEDYRVKDIILFGSIARDDYGLYSDADILIILEQSDKKRYFDRIPELLEYFLISIIHVDIFPYTVEEISRMRDNNAFIKRAISEGVSLLT